MSAESSKFALRVVGLVAPVLKFKLRKVQGKQMKVGAHKTRPHLIYFASEQHEKSEAICVQPREGPHEGSCALFETASWCCL